MTGPPAPAEPELAAATSPAIVPSASTPGARRRMQATGRKDTAPELALRRELHHRGRRYRVEVALPGLPRRRMDVVFPAARLVVLVDGCFWHGCPEHGTTARSNARYWTDKIEANRARDRDTDRRLARAGWTVLRVWEHEDPSAAADRVEAHLPGGKITAASGTPLRTCEDLRTVQGPSR